jgi:adenine nucleotide transporter 17
MAPPTQPPSPLAHAISGSLGSALALLVFYPLERVRTELQSSATPSSSLSSALTPSCPLTPPVETEKEHQDAGDNPEEQKQQDTPISPQSLGRVELLTTDLSPSSGGNYSSSDSWTLCHDDPAEGDGTHETGAGSSHASVGRSVSCASSPTETLLACGLRLQEQGDLYRGVGPVVSTLAASNFVFFFVHQALKRFESKTLKSTWKAIFLSTLAGVVNVMLTNPLWVANLRIMKGSTTNNSLLREMHSIARKEGIASLWNGMTSSLLLVTNPVIQFFCYEQFKQLLLVRRRRQSRSRPQHSQLAPLEAFVLGALAKAIATIITYPLQLSQVLLRLQESNNANNTSTLTSASLPHSSPYSGTVSCLRYLLQGRGLPALFTGLEAKLLQTCLTAALTFCTYEQLLRAVQKTLCGLSLGTS